MRTVLPQQPARNQSHRPRAITVFAAAFVAGAAAAVGVNRTLDVRLAQAKPRVESEAIFVALRSLPQGTPVTVWDVALRDWPKAMLPASALRAHDSFSGQVLRHPLREGQPLLSIQLLPASSETGGPADAQPTPPPAAYTQVSAPVQPPVEADLWSPAEPASPPVAAGGSQPAPTQPAPAAASSPPAAWPQPVSAPAIAPPAQPPVDATAATPTDAPSADVRPTPVTPDASQPDGQPSPPSRPNLAAIDVEPAPAAEPPATRVAAVETAPPSPVATAPGASLGDGAAAPAPQPALAASTPAGQPTVAEPPVEIAAVPQTPTVVADIVVPEPVAEPVSVIAPAAPAPPPVAVVAVRPLPRYLVVPENIAVQADRSFAIPTTPVPPAQGQLPVTGPAGVQQLPPTSSSTVAAARSRPAAQPAQPQRQASGQEPRQPQQRQGRQPAPTSGSGPTGQPRLGAAMFPNISAGIEVIEGEWGRLRRDRSTAEEQPAPRQQPVTAR